MLTWPIVRRMLLLTPLMAAGTLGLFLYDLGEGTYAFAQTRAFTTLAAFQWFHLLNARSFYLSVFQVGLFSTRWLVLSLGIAVLLQLGAVYTGVGQVDTRECGRRKCRERALVKAVFLRGAR